MAERGLTAAAVGALIPLMTDVGFEELGEVKALLRRFFSAEPWTAVDAAALARAVGRPPARTRAADRVIHHRIDADLTLVAGWVDERFAIDVELRETVGSLDQPSDTGVDLGRTFEYGVVPEPTPNPRTVRFATARRGAGRSESYRRRDRGKDERVAAIFDVDDDVVDVLVGSDFVAVSIARPGRWPGLLEPVLEAVAAAFGGRPEHTGRREPPAEPEALDVRGVSRGARPMAAPADRRTTRLERAWADLGALRASEPGDLSAIVAAARAADAARRQVAANLLGGAPPDVAAQVWSELAADTSRAVRRATLDALVDAEREELRPLLERALGDPDAWVRWKALHGLVVLGARPSLEAIRRLDADPDFRVRLESENAQRRLKRL